MENKRTLHKDDLREFTNVTDNQQPTVRVGETGIF